MSKFIVTYERFDQPGHELEKIVEAEDFYEAADKVDQELNSGAKPEIIITGVVDL